jgi:hypothetical protein
MSEPQVTSALREARRRATRELIAGFGGYRRTRPRDADEAALLRELGVPEHLIGPVRPSSEPGERER